MIWFRTEYFEDKLNKWISFYSGTYEECMKYINTPIIRDPPVRVAKYEKSGVRKIKYKYIETVCYKSNM